MSKNFWNTKLQDYAKEDWAKNPSIFAEFAKDFFPKKGKLLELAAGYGQDGRYFASLGYEVTQSDFSETGIKYLRENKFDGMKVKKIDMQKQLDFADQTFDIVYCHLGIHYFTWDKTKELVKEIKRVLKPNGIVALFTNSSEDPEYATGEKIEEHYFRIGKLDKRYFSVETMGELMNDFKSIILDNKGTTYKDSKIGVFNLIRYIGKKLYE